MFFINNHNNVYNFNFNNVYLYNFNYINNFNYIYNFNNFNYFNHINNVYNNGTTSVVKVHRVLFSGQGGIMEYYQDLSGLMTDAGITGKVGEPRVTNNSIEVFTDRIQLILRSPLNRLQDLVSTSWKFIGDWPVRTDATTGDAARFKRFVEIQHGE